MKMCLIMNEITVPDNKIKKVLKHSVSRKTAGSFCIGDRLKCGSVRSVDVSVINVKTKAVHIVFGDKNRQKINKK